LASYASDEVAGYHLPQYILIDLAVGKAGGTPADSTNEMKMYVDWVRVYAPLSN
jgi:beta-glucanase (GH16 family)